MPRDVPKVLVLLASLNGEAWIREQIDSILRQSGVDVHILVRDDGSSDSTVSIVRDLADLDARVQLTTDGIPSGSAAQNFLSLIRTSAADNFEFVALSDQDDVWNPDKLRQAANTLKSKPLTGYSSAVTATWPGGQTRILRQQDKMTESDFLFEGGGQGCTFVLPTPLYERIRSFLAEKKSLTGGIRYHDWVIYALVRSWGFAWIFDQNSTMRYRQHGHNDTGARASLKGITSRLQKIRSGWYRDQLLAVSEICRAAENSNPAVATWHSLLRMTSGWQKRWQMGRFCIARGRRRRSDNAALTGAVILGWI